MQVRLPGGYLNGDDRPELPGRRHGELLPPVPESATVDAGAPARGRAKVPCFRANARVRRSLVGAERAFYRYPSPWRSCGHRDRAHLVASDYLLMGHQPFATLPDDMVNSFEDTDTGDETKNAILADVVRGIEALDVAIAESDPGHEAVDFYHVGEGNVSAETYLRGLSENTLSWGGEVTYYAFEVDNEERRSKEPIVSYCIDLTALQDKDLETGKLLPKSPDGPRFFSEQVVTHQNDEGIWHVAGVLPVDEQLNEECQR